MTYVPYVSLTKTQTGEDHSERYLFVRPEHVVAIECERGTTRLLLSTGHVRFVRETMAEALEKLDRFVRETMAEALEKLDPSPATAPYRPTTAGDSE